KVGLLKKRMAVSKQLFGDRHSFSMYFPHYVKITTCGDYKSVFASRELLASRVVEATLRL
ncbi:MAG: hypothetical protein RI894_879, partial [Bacteroidota bacterium]